MRDSAAVLLASHTHSITHIVGANSICAVMASGEALTSRPIGDKRVVLFGNRVADIA